MSATNQQRLNGHKEVQSEPVIALHLSVQKKVLENTENAAGLANVQGAFATSSSWDPGRVRGMLWSRVFLEHLGSFSQGGAKALAKVGMILYISGGLYSNELHQVLKGGPQINSCSSITWELVRSAKFSS